MNEMNTSKYNNAKNLIDKINKLDRSYHFELLNILKNYNLSHSKNVNGFFFDFQNLDDDILQKLNIYVENIEMNMRQDELSTERCSPNVVNESNSISQIKESSNITTVNNECYNILNNLSTNKKDIDMIMNTIEKDKPTQKRPLANKFTICKKKYSKPVINEIKYNIAEFLTYDDTI